MSGKRNCAPRQRFVRLGALKATAAAASGCFGDAGREGESLDLFPAASFCDRQQQLEHPQGGCGAIVASEPPPVAEARQDLVQVVPLMLHTHNFTSRGCEACTKSPGLSLVSHGTMTAPHSKESTAGCPQLSNRVPMPGRGRESWWPPPGQAGEKSRLYLAQGKNQIAGSERQHFPSLNSLWFGFGFPSYPFSYPEGLSANKRELFPKPSP